MSENNTTANDDVTDVTNDTSPPQLRSGRASWSMLLSVVAFRNNIDVNVDDRIQQNEEQFDDDGNSVAAAMKNENQRLTDIAMKLISIVYISNRRSPWQQLLYRVVGSSRF